MPRHSLIISDELGRPRSLSAGPSAYERLLPPAREGAGTLLLGLGPFPGDLAGTLAEPVRYVEASDFEQALGPDLAARVPAGWSRAEPGDLAGLAAEAAVWSYRQNLRLFNSFWGPVLARILAARMGYGKPAAGTSVLLPGDEGSLLTVELAAALGRMGYAVRRIPERAALEETSRILRQERPACLLSVNGRGLDADGRLFRLLEACKVPTALWLVDNPWQVLSAWRQPWWREAAVFVTDASFVAPLADCGARRVRHVPLGAWMPPPDRDYAGPPLRPITFVGRSAFPDKAAFFSGLHADPRLMTAAGLAARPDFAWWAGRLGLKTLWPGKDVRLAGFGAETCSQARRARWLRAAGEMLTVFGDDGWRALLPEGADLRPPLDYYAGLSRVYAASRYSLNVTSLLLPAGLTQRHFDVWSCGGFLLTDATPGMDIFPEELTRPVTLTRPEDLPVAVERLEKDPTLRVQLGAAWRACLAGQHGLEHRLANILSLVEVFEN